MWKLLFVIIRLPPPRGKEFSPVTVRRNVPQIEKKNHPSKERLYSTIHVMINF